MAITNYTLPFNLQNSTKFDIRNRPDKLIQSDLRSWRFEQSEGIRPAEYYAPYRYMPVGFKDANTEDYVVIPKGRIVGALSTEDTGVSGIMYPSGMGNTQTIGFAATEMGGAAIQVNQDSFFGYGEFTSNLLVLANGGVRATGFYTSYDVTAGTITYSGTLAVASGNYVIPANAPIGVVYHDWYQDIRGRNINYQMHPEGGHVLTDWFVEVPYIKASNTGMASGCSPRYSNNDYANLLKWYDVNKQFTYLAVENSETSWFRNGNFVQSDVIGNYKPQPVFNSVGTCINASGEAPSQIVLDSYTTAAKTNQTVGKVLSIDNRMPKGSLEDVLTYPGSGMPGSQTAGMIKVLFDFAYQCLKIGPYGGAGTAPSIEAVYTAIRRGYFGLARIQLLIS